MTILRTFGETEARISAAAAAVTAAPLNSICCFARGMRISLHRLPCICFNAMHVHLSVRAGM